MECRCGRCDCGAVVKSKRVFVNKEHRLAWMVTGGAREIDAFQPVGSKRVDSQIAGRAGVESDPLTRAGLKGAQRSREISDGLRRVRSALVRRAASEGVAL